MKNNDSNSQTGLPNQVIFYAIQLLALALLLVWCFKILEPFITILIWAAVLAITLYPAHRGLTRRLKNRNGLSATIITIIMLILIVGPAVWLLVASADELKNLGASYKSGELNIPAPPEKVKDWPIIGAKVNGYWTEASQNLTVMINHHREEIKPILLQLVALLKNTTKGILFFFISIIVSGVMLTYAKPVCEFATTLLTKIAGQAGETMARSSELTVRNVAKGVLGVAIIQSLLAGAGFVVAGIPFAGLWILVCLFLAIIQIGILPVAIGVVIYIWGTADTLTATMFTIWMVFVSVIDNVIKPFLLGKGAPAPMLVVFLGAIGGFILSGFIGLFTGAIVLTLGYKLINGWIAPVQQAETSNHEPTKIE